MLVGRNRSGQSRRILCVIARQRPGTSGLCAFEHEKLEVLAVIEDWDTPFAIVVLERQRIIDADPRASFDCFHCAQTKDRPSNLVLAVNCYMYYDNMSRINNQFSVGVHIMTALGDHHGEQVTSAHLTASVRAHDSQVRSVLSKLVKAGLVVTSRGRNGFSSLSRPANKISLLEIYKAVGAPPVFSIHEYPREKTCRTSCTHKQAMVELLEDTQRAFEARLGERMLTEMVAKARSYK
jgi:DNA-binding IscR family transcriptional regulator